MKNMKKVISLLIVAVLFIYGAATLLAEESTVKDISVLSEPVILPSGDTSTLCGDGNGGGGCPG